MTTSDTASAGGRTGHPSTDDPDPRNDGVAAALARTKGSGRVVAIGVPSLVLAAHTAFYGPWIEDDAGITFAYARSLATGAGPVLQPGADPVEGYSNPTWLLIMVVGRWLGLFDHGAWFGVPDLVLFPKLVALACAAIMFGCVYSLARVVTRWPVVTTVVAGTITASIPSFVVWTMSGLENGLFALFVVALGTRLAHRAVEGRLLEERTAIVCGLLASGAALTRPDGLIYVAAFPVAALLVLPDGVRHTSLRRALLAGRTVRVAAMSIGAAALPLVLYLTWRLATFGDWLPNTARAKRQELPGPGNLDRPAELIGYAGWLAVLLVAAAVALTLASRSRTRTAVAMLLVPLALALAAFAILPPDWMEQYRFATPVWAIGPVIATLAVANAWSGRGARARLVAGGVAVLAVASSVVSWAGQASEFRANPTAPMCFVASSVGQRVNEYADILQVRDGSLLAVDGGGTALTSRLRFVDLSGLTDVRFADLWQRRDDAGARDYVYEVVRPTFFKIDSGWAGAANAGLLRDPRLDRDYVLLLSQRPGSGTWVRRDAVPAPAALVLARRHAMSAWQRLDVPFLVSDRTAWTCGPTLRPPD